MLLPKPAPVDRLRSRLGERVALDGVAVVVESGVVLGVAAGDEPLVLEPKPLDREVGLGLGLRVGLFAGEGRKFWVVRKLRFCTGAGGAL